MKPGKNKVRVIVWLCMSAMGVASLLAPAEARAQSRGQIILTQKPIPSDVSKRKLRRFFKKNRIRKLAPVMGTDKYKAYVAARLRRKPSQADLKRNSGQIHLAFYVRNKGRWKYHNVMHINYPQGSTLVRFGLQIPEGFGLEPGKKYQLRLTILGSRKQEVTLAKTTFGIKKKAKSAK
jgi:hypothetical protein